MLAYDPGQRISAKIAVDHKFFTDSSSRSQFEAKVPFHNQLRWRGLLRR